MISYEGTCLFCGKHFKFEYNESTAPQDAPQHCTKAHQRAWNRKQKSLPYDAEKNEQHIQQNYKQKRAKPHSDQSRQSAAREFDFRCPTPYKQGFLTEELALEYIKVVHPDEQNFGPYKCRCGSIHVGHSVQPTTPRVHENMIPVTVIMEREWCAYPKKSGFMTVEDAYLWCVGRLLPEHVTPFTCTCGYVHLHISDEGKKYRESNLKRSRITRPHPLLKEPDDEG